MARVTIEDCIEKIGSHFKVVQVAAHRAHQLELGTKPQVEKENDKSVVIALREIAEDKIDEKILRKPLAEKEDWQQKEKFLLEPGDVGQSVTDVEHYSDINEVEDDNATDENNTADISQQSLASEADEESSKS
ncbi:MAG: DNA-directed RNA polymerase subunit omega [Chromatiales bacterium]|nr:DNA-directed RNA polymerase subunit omega [Chromatiales bacterium]